MLLCHNDYMYITCIYALCNAMSRRNDNVSKRGGQSVVTVLLTYHLLGRDLFHCLDHFMSKRISVLVDF